MIEEAPHIDEESLRFVVQKILRNSSATVTKWNAKKVYGGAGSSSCVYRLKGKANYDNCEADWSVVLKVLLANGSNETSWNYWKREALIYQGGVFSRLEKIQLPECYFVEEITTARINMWLQDLNLSHRHFSSRDFENVAYELGKMNAYFLDSRIQDKQSYFSKEWLNGYVTSAARGIEVLRGDFSNPYVNKLFPGTTRQKLIDLWQQKNLLLSRIKSLPQTLCHLDAISKNIFLSEPGENIVLIDWAYTGLGTLGQELAPLIVGSILLYDAELSSLDKLEQSLIPIYLLGLQDVGWRGNKSELLAGMYLGIALRYALYGVVHLPTLLDERLHSWIEKTTGHQLEDFIQRVSCVQNFALEATSKVDKFFM